jgi:hypothetical protein
MKITYIDTGGMPVHPETEYQRPGPIRYTHVGELGRPAYRQLVLSKFDLETPL